MASIAIPLISAAVPLLTPLIESLVTHVESMFGAKTGPTKFDAVLTAVSKVAADLGTAGKIPGQLDTASLATMIETVVQQFKADGILTPSVQPAPAVTAAPKPGTFQVSGTINLT
jgi:uncharacterized protein (DUF697 family)